MTTVVHVRQSGFVQFTPGFVYIGRDFAEFEDEGWGNHLHVGPDGTRPEVLVKYRDWAESRSGVWRWNAYRALNDKQLGCWCKPLACHGDVLAEIVDMITPIQDPSVFVGLSYDDARMQIGGRGYSNRLTHVDGKALSLPRDGYDPLRINLKVQSNRVTEATIG